MDSFDAVIVGAGIVGCAAASELAPDHDVLVVEADQVAGGATGKASGLVSPVYDFNDQLDAARYATDRFHELDGTGNFEFTDRTGVSLVSEGELDAEREKVERAREADFAASFLDLDEAADVLPAEFDLSEFAAVAAYEDAGWVDPHTLTTTLKTLAEEEGAEFLTGVRVESIVGDEAVTAVETTEGRFEAATVVVAAGWRTRDLVAEHVEVPVRPFRYQSVALEPSFDIGDVPMAWEHETRLYWRPEHNGSLHVGGQPYFVADPGSVRTQVRESFRDAIAMDLPNYLPAISDARFGAEDTCATGDAATPDTNPIIDAPADGPSGLVVATGMHGFGIMMMPVAGAAVRAVVTDEAAPFSLEPYRLDRFEDRGIDFGSSYIRT